MNASSDCLACGLVSGAVDLAGGRIHERSGWVVEHCIGPLGVGTVIVKPIRHIEHVADLSTDEADALGPLLRDASRMLTELVDPGQVYVCLWSHGGGVAGHIHFVVQPVDLELMARHGGLYGPDLQQAMFRENVQPLRPDIEAFCDRARVWFA